MAGYYTYQYITYVEPDYRVALLTQVSVEDAALTDLADHLEQYGEDRNGDGEVKIEIMLYANDGVPSDDQNFSNYLESVEVFHAKYISDFDDCSSMLWIIDETSYEIDVVDQVRGKITVSGEEAAKLVEEVREEAKRLSAMIYLLSNITIKDEKTHEEYVLEQAYIKQLVSNEARNTMEMLVANRQLLDESTAICFSDFLNGYVRHGEQRIAISISSYGDVKNI